MYCQQQQNLSTSLQLLSLIFKVSSQNGTHTFRILPSTNSKRSGTYFAAFLHISTNLTDRLRNKINNNNTKGPFRNPIGARMDEGPLSATSCKAYFGAPLSETDRAASSVGLAPTSDVTKSGKLTPRSFFPAEKGRRPGVSGILITRERDVLRNQFGPVALAMVKTFASSIRKRCLVEEGWRYVALVTRNGFWVFASLPSWAWNMLCGEARLCCC